MKNYICEGRYNGKVILRVKAAGLADAARKLLVECDEETIEVRDPSQIAVDEKTLREE